MALGVLVLAAAPGRAQERTAEAILATVSSGPDVLVAVRDLSALGRRSAHPLFDELTRGEELSRLQRTALELALESLPRELWLVPLREAARGADETGREAALAVLTRAGTRADLALALELGAALEPGAGTPGPRQLALKRALRAILAREPAALVELEELFLRADPATREPVVDVLSESAGEGTAARLAALLARSDAASKALLLDALARAASRGYGLDDEAVSEAVRVELGSLDKSLVVLACGVLEKLCDHAAVPDLIVLLGDGDVSVRRRAHGALTRLTGVELPEHEDGWLAWLDESYAWWDTRSEPCRVALVSGSPAEAAAAVVELAHQRFRRDLVVQALTLTFARADEDVVASALAALAAIPDPRAQLALQRYRDEARGALATSVEEAHRRVDQRLARAGARPTLRPPGRRRTP